MDGTSLLLVALVALPLAAAVVIAALGAQRAAQARMLALAVSLVGVVLAIFVAGQFLQQRSQHPPIASAHPTFMPEMVPGADPTNPHKTTWNLIEFGTNGAIQFYLGIDGLNVWLVVLTALLMVPAVLVSWTAIDERANEYYAWLLVLGAGLMGVFLAFDLILFYVFFELTLVPLFFLIGIWGGPERRHAARKFFIYTLAGSLITFVGLLAVVVVIWQGSGDTPASRRLTFSIPELINQVNLHLRVPSEQAFWSRFQVWLFLALFAGFSIKVPLFPMHTWLPLAHVEAPTAGSVLLAGVLLKMGTYGFLRFAMPLFPNALQLCAPWIAWISIIGIIYGALVAMVQTDIKKLVAYSSVSHMGFCMLGLMAMNPQGFAGSMMTMLNHGISTGALFLLVGVIYERRHTRKIADFGGLWKVIPVFSVIFLVVTLSSIGLPATNGFIGEFLVLLGASRHSMPWAVGAALGVILSACYMLWMYQRVVFGPVTHEENAKLTDLTLRERLVFLPLLVLIFWMGVAPQPFLDRMQPALDRTLQLTNDRAAAAGRLVGQLVREAAPVTTDATGGGK